MTRILDHHAFSARPALSRRIFGDRAAQFVTRHGWPLDLSGEGQETDQFDAPGTEYLIAEEAGVPLASLRLRRARLGSLTEAAFPALWDRHADRLAGLSEVTRFCAAPGADAPARRAAVAELLLGLCRHGGASGQALVFGIVYPGVARAIRHAGWDHHRLDRFETDGRETWLCLWACTAETEWRLGEGAARLAERAAVARQQAARAA
ncbi:acyl-homoserine-lactone synthase [Mangrovicoccus algicola]|uniref:Acyl-homoserine-lactone synthase n=1 Tax=Mangrovicoccus algicola TaxID=2771008 RepID=A0A8J6YWF1_9RHOB|nr:acyl-homoserine-lactone synthase [Mangrovicoccus algicola]MBE3637026.1 hypothetical protein [Mangrovicoccus algicola]